MKLILLVFAIMLFSMLSVSAQTAPPIEAGVSRELARWRAANYSNVRYKLDLTLEKMSPTLKGSIEIRVEVKPNAGQIILDWRKIRGKEELTTVSNAAINSKPAKFVEQNEHLIFRENVVAGENLIKLDFTSPIATSGAAITRYVDREDGAEYIYSLFVPSDASTAFPVFDQPDLKARFKLILDISKEWKAVSNTNAGVFEPDGYSLEETNRRAIYHFEETQPISTYVFAFAAGDFTEFEEKDHKIAFAELVKEGKSYVLGEENIVLTDELRAKTGSHIFVRKSQAEKFKQHEKEVFRLNREAVNYLETYFDYKFPFPKYDLVLIPEFPFGGMEHAGATFLRESSIIFPQEPTANDYISRGNLIFHEAAHQWFGDTVTMRWFDDLWLKEGFAEFMAYKTMEKVLPQYNAWKAFYERNKPLAYQTDSTRGTTAIYQDIPNLSAAKSAYGNIVYRKAPAFLRQAEFYLGEKQFQTAVRAFLKQNAFKNAEWQDLVKSFETASGQDLKNWSETWVKKRGLPMIGFDSGGTSSVTIYLSHQGILNENAVWEQKIKVLFIERDGKRNVVERVFKEDLERSLVFGRNGVFLRHIGSNDDPPVLIFPNYEDYGYGIFLLDKHNRDYVLANIQNEKDDFLRSMMWGALWDSVRYDTFFYGKLNPREYVELAIKNVGSETDELTIQTILNRASTAMNYYLDEKQTLELAPRLERILLERMTKAATTGQRIVFYRAFLQNVQTNEARQTLKNILGEKLEIKNLTLKTKDKFDIVTRLLILNDADAPRLLAELEKRETSDDAKRYAYAARAGIATADNKDKFFNDFTNNKEISESWIESAFVPFNAVRQDDLTAPFLAKSLAELPNLKRNRKIFFVNGWLAAFIGGQKSAESLDVINKFLADNQNLDKDLRLKILEVADNLERSLKIRRQFAQK